MSTKESFELIANSVPYVKVVKVDRELEADRHVVSKHQQKR
jgi:hypothetical protein